jgi:hypothetical protein
VPPPDQRVEGLEFAELTADDEQFVGEAIWLVLFARRHMNSGSDDVVANGAERFIPPGLPRVRVSSFLDTTAAFPGGSALAEAKMGALLSFIAAPMALALARVLKVPGRSPALAQPALERPG